MKRPTVLIVDDSEINREILCEILQDKYDLIQATNGLEAIEQLNKRIDQIDLLLLDNFMPLMSGLEVLQIMQDRQWNKRVPTIMISAATEPEFIETAYEYGVFDFISRPFNFSVVQHRVENTILVFGKQKQLESLVEHEVQEKGRQSDMLINVLAHTVEFRNGESGQHILNVRQITQTLLKRWIEIDPKVHFTKQQIKKIALASSLHDIGKISIDDGILNKPGKLSSEEWEIMKQHTVAGEELLQSIPKYQNDELIRYAREIARSHHERYDGKGYPDGLKGDEIPITAQVVAMADVYDALTAQRAYKEAFSHEKAIQMIINGESGTFNPMLLKCLQDKEASLKRIKEAYSFETESDMEEYSPVDLEIEPDEYLSLDQAKTEFFTTHSPEVRYYISLHPPILTFSHLPANRFDLPEVILEPSRSDVLKKYVDQKTLHYIMTKLGQLTKEAPDFELELQFGLKEDRRWWYQKMRALFNKEGEKVGYVGIQFDIDDEMKRRQYLEDTASHDPLTGLLYKQYAKERIEKQWLKNQANHFALAVLDLDHFKEANDNYGHEFGDLVLKELASRLLANTRSEDIVARIGGDEFMIIFKYNAHIETIVRRVFDSVQKESFSKFPIRLSMGVASTQNLPKDFTVLFEKADEMLYKAKRNGRNGLYIYQGEEDEE